MNNISTGSDNGLCVSRQQKVPLFPPGTS